MTSTPVAPFGYYAPFGDKRYFGGLSSPRTQLLYIIEVDWDDDGIFDGTNESRWLVPGGIEVNRGRERYVNSSGTGFVKVGVGTCEIKLDNSDERYTPRNTESYLYPYLLDKSPRKARVRVKNGDSGSIYSWITGKLVDFDLEPGRRGESYMHLRIEDGMRDLKKAKTSVDMQTSIKVNEAIQMVLDDIGWEGGTDLENGIDTIPYWWVYDRSAYAEIMDLAESELGHFFIANDGVATYHNRLHTSSEVISLDGAEISPRIGEAQPSETVRDKVIVKVHPCLQRSSSVLWTLQDEEYYIAAGETRHIFAEYTYNNRPVPAYSVSTPVAYTDYEMNSVSGGGGTDLTGDFDVSLSNLGEAGKLTLENTGATGGFVTLAQVQGVALDSPDAVGVYSGDGENVLTIDLAWQQLVNTGQSLADFMAGYLGAGSNYLTISFENAPTKQFALDLMDWMSLEIASREIFESFRVPKIRYKAIKRGVVETTLWLEPHTGTDLDNYTQLPFLLPAQLAS